MIESFIDKYKSKNIIYPDAVARYFNISLKKAYEELEKQKSSVKNIRNLYMIRCPACNNVANYERFYNSESIDTDNEIGCCHCDYEFLPDWENNITSLYEKI